MRSLFRCCILPSIALALCMMSVPSSEAQASNCSAAYDPALGTLPSEQGWVHISDNLAESNYQLYLGATGLELIQGYTSPDNNVQYYKSTSCQFNFESTAVTATANLWIHESTESSSPCCTRYGWSMSLRDEAGRTVVLYVGRGGAFLLGQETEISGPIFVNAEGSFHEYQLVVGPEGASVQIDGSPTTLSLSLDQFNMGPAESAMRLGDGTSLAHSRSRLRQFGLSALDLPVATTSTSWGAVKSMYENE